eukprot:TRINITY_DN18838_c0_g1_i1.p1 TRINITY_DN18838_c0_g1~~TRINITY_DN18838_c0_g1_i1.p1  ORF type:complete len:170 (+),score=36.21 TRINITY_DN18838_c0_g1_i1:160-669(+)
MEGGLALAVTGKANGKGKGSSKAGGNMDFSFGKGRGAKGFGKQGYGKSFPIGKAGGGSKGYGGSKSQGKGDGCAKGMRPAGKGLKANRSPNWWQTAERLDDLKRPDPKPETPEDIAKREAEEARKQARHGLRSATTPEELRVAIEVARSLDLVDEVKVGERKILKMAAS